jgi:hypothetical protein
MLEELCSRHVVSARRTGAGNAGHDFLIRRQYFPIQISSIEFSTSENLELDRLEVECVLTRDLRLCFSARARSPDTLALAPMSAPAETVPSCRSPSGAGNLREEMSIRNSKRKYNPA